MTKEPKHLDQYLRELREKREREIISEDAANELSAQRGQGLTSPAAEVSTEELKLLKESIMVQNLSRMGQALPARRRAMMLRTFFKHKRNMTVEVFVRVGEHPLDTLGKVTAVGRDFVGLSTLRERLFIPYAAIESARVPFGTPDVSYTHQHLILDEKLRRQLLTSFGETVAKREELVRQFFEESLETHLQGWTGTRAEVIAEGRSLAGTLRGAQGGVLTVKTRNGPVKIPLAKITLLRTLRLLAALRHLFSR